MKKSISFDNVKLINGGSNNYLLTLKNLYLKLEGNTSNSIISESKEERDAIVSLLLNPFQRHGGEIIFAGDYFKSKSIKDKEAITFISTKQIDELSKMDIDVETLFNSAVLNSPRQVKLAKDYLKVLNNEKKDIIHNLSLFNSDRSYNIYLKERFTEFYREWFIESEKELREYVEKTERLKEIEERFALAKAELKEIKKEFKYSTTDSINNHRSKHKSIIKTYKDLIDHNKDLLKREKQELFSKKSLSAKPSQEALEQMHNSVRAETLNLTKYVQKLPITGFELNANIKALIKKLEEPKTRRDKFNESLDELITYLEKFKKFLNFEHIQEIDYWIEYINNISDFKSALNSQTFNEALAFVRTTINTKIKYFKQYVKDIDEKEASIAARDKQERDHQRRKLWEFDIISLRFEKQIYLEKLELTNEYLNYLQQVGIKHTKQNYEMYYDIFEDYLEKMLKIDSSLNKWRFSRDLKAIKINRDLEIDIIDEQIKKLNRERKQLQKTIIKEGIFKFRIETYPIKNAEKITPDYQLTEIEQKDKIKNEKILKKQLKEIEKLIEEQKLIIKNEWDEEVEDLMWSLMEDFGFKNDFINTKLNQLSKAQLQKVSLIKSKIEGFEILLLEEPSIDFELDSTYSIKSAIDKLTSKHETMVVIVTNNINIASDLCENINLISKGGNVERGSSKEVMLNPLHPFTKMMIKNVNKIKYSTQETSFSKHTYQNLFYNRHSELKFQKINKDHELFVSDDVFKRLVK